MKKGACDGATERADLTGVESVGGGVLEAPEPDPVVLRRGRQEHRGRGGTDARHPHPSKYRGEVKMGVNFFVRKLS